MAQRRIQVVAGMIESEKWAYIRTHPELRKIKLPKGWRRLDSMPLMKDSLFLLDDGTVFGPGWQITPPSTGPRTPHHSKALAAAAGTSTRVEPASRRSTIRLDIPFTSAFPNLPCTRSSTV